MSDVSATASVKFTLSATMDSRYNFAPQFLIASAFFSREAARLEEAHRGGEQREELQAEHRAFVVGAVMQSSAALEAEITQILLHGPGHQLGSNGVDANAREFLSPLLKMVDKRPVLERFGMVLHLLRKPALDHGAAVHQMADLLVRFRNELVHYKAKHGIKIKPDSLVQQLAGLKLPKPPFLEGPGAHPFPLPYLSAGLAAWAVDAARRFLDEFYSHLGVENPFHAYQATLAAYASGPGTPRGRT